jgi:hypothetical protein
MYTQVGATGVTGTQGATGPSQWTGMTGIGPQGFGYSGIGYTGDVLVYGNMLVTGSIDPVRLIVNDSTKFVDIDTTTSKPQITLNDSISSSTTQLVPDSITMSNVLGGAGAFNSQILITNPPAISQVKADFADNTFTTSTEINAQSAATEYLASVADTGTTLTTKRFLTANGSVQNTDRATNGTVIARLQDIVDYTFQTSTTHSFTTGTGDVFGLSSIADATKAEIIANNTTATSSAQTKTTIQTGLTSQIAESKDLTTTEFSTKTIINTPTLAIDQLSYISDTGFTPDKVSQTTTQLNSTSALVNQSYRDTTGGVSTRQSTTMDITDTSVIYTAEDITNSRSNILKIEVPVSSDAIIEHSVLGAVSRNLAINTTGDLRLTSDTLNATATNLSMTSASAGGALNPLLTLTNTNAAGSVALEVYKNKPTAGVNGEPLFTQSVFGKDSGNNKQEYTRITHTIRDITSGSEEGSIEMGCFIGGTYNNMLQLNGVDSPAGEVNILRPIDLSTGSTGLIKISGSGSTDMTLDATLSQGTGNININPKVPTGVINLNGSVDMNNSETIFIRDTGNDNRVEIEKNQIDMTSTDISGDGSLFLSPPNNPKSKVTIDNKEEVLFFNFNDNAPFLNKESGEIAI